VVLVGDERN